MNRPRVLLADDHKIVLEGLKNLLEPEFELVGAVEDGRALLDAATNLHPEVIVTDISMPLLNGIEAARQIKKISPNVKVIFLTMHPDPSYAAEALEAGASGYVLKHSAPQCFHNPDINHPNNSRNEIGKTIRTILSIFFTKLL